MLVFSLIILWFLTSSVFSSSSISFTSARETENISGNSESAVSSAPVAAFTLPKPMLSRSSGFQGNIYRNSAVESIIACLYSLPSVQGAFYEEAARILTNCSSEQKASLVRTNFVVSTALLFAKLRFRNAPIEIPTPFVESLRVLLGSETNIALFSVGRLWTEIYRKLPERILKLFHLDMNVNFFQIDTANRVLSVTSSSKKVLINMWTEYDSIIDIIDKGDLYSPSKDGVHLVRDPSKGPESEKIPTICCTALVGRPDVFTVMLNRISYDPKTGKLCLDEKRILANFNLTINGMRYKLMANIEFDPELQTYRSNVHDPTIFGFYQFENGRFAYPPDIDLTIINTRSVILFYVPEFSVDALEIAKYQTFSDISPSITSLLTEINFEHQTPKRSLNGRHINPIGSSLTSTSPLVYPANYLPISATTEYLSEASEPIVTESRENASYSVNPVDCPLQATNEVSSQTDQSSIAWDAWDHIYKPNYSDYPPEKLKFFKGMEGHINSKISSSWSVPMLDVYSKFLFKTYELGSDSFSFKTESKALELIIVAIAFDITALTHIIDLYQTIVDQVRQVETLNEAIAITICKVQFGVKDIQLKQIEKFLPSDCCGPYQDLAHLSSQIHKIIEAINNGAISTPQMKIVEYSSLSTDDPDKMYFTDSHAINVESIIPQRDARIRGIWCDCTDKAQPERRLRYIFSSDSAIVPVSFDRLSGSSQFNKKQMCLNSTDYTPTGYIRFNPESTSVSVCISRSDYILVFENGCISRQVAKSSDEGQLILAEFSTNSILSFSVKKSSPTVPKRISISKNIISNIIYDVGRDSGFRFSRSPKIIASPTAQSEKSH
jgi:hypothetical protein